MRIRLRRYNRLFERQETSFLCQFGKFPCSWIRISIPNRIWIQGTEINADPIHNTGFSTGIGFFICTITRWSDVFQCCGSALVSMRIRIQIRIQGTKPMRIYVVVDPDPGPGQTLKSQNVKFSHLSSIKASSGTVKFYRLQMTQC